MQVPYSICAKVSSADNLWQDKSRCRENTERVMRKKGGGVDRGRVLSGSHTHAGSNTATHECVAVYYEGAIREYIRNQLEDDIATDQISMKEFVDPFTGEPVIKG